MDSYQIILTLYQRTVLCSVPSGSLPLAAYVRWVYTLKLPQLPLMGHSYCPLSFTQVDGILKTVLRDEIIAWHKKTQEDTSSPLSAAGQPENMDSQQLVSLVQKAVTAIMTRLHNLAQFDGGESKVNTLVAAANSLDNLCRMDPAWHPWL